MSREKSGTESGAHTKVPFMQMEAPVPIAARRRRLTLLALLALVTIAVFAKGLTGGFINDDLTLIARNPDLKSLAGLPHLLARPMWSGLTEFAGADVVGHWRPLTSMVLALGYGLGGSADSPLAFHLLSLALHLVASWAAFRLATRLLRSDLAGAGVALVFALHPLHVESVSWISAINDPLFGALVLLALDAWLAWREREAAGERCLPWGAAGLFFCALLAKEYALALIPILLVLDLLHGDKPGEAGRLKPWLVVAGVLGLWLGLRMAIFDDLLGGLGRHNTDYGGAIWRARAELFGGGMWHLFVPEKLSPLEPFREAWPAGSPEKAHKLVGLALFAATVAIGLAAKLRGGKRSLLLVSSLGILAAVSPALAGIRSLGQTPFADRYWYLAVFFFGLFVVALLRLLVARRETFALALVALLGLWYAALDVSAQDAWKSPEDFYRTVIERHPDTPAGYWNLAELKRADYIASIQKGGAGRVPLLNEAFELYDKSASLLAQAARDETIPKDEFDYLRTGVGQAWCYLLQAEADQYRDFDTPQKILDLLLEQVLRREATNEARGGLRGRLPVEEVLTTLGIVKLRAGKQDEAAEDFRRALEFNPSYVPAMHNLAAARFHAGQFGLSSKLLSDALELTPGDPKLLELYAQSLFEEGWTERALEVSKELEEANPASPVPEILRGLEALKTRDFEGALGHFDKALAKDPRSSVALFQRGMALHELGQLDEAIVALRKACESDPEDFTAHYNLASVLFERGAPDTARPYLERAYAAGTGRSELPLVRQTLLALDPKNVVRMRSFAELDDGRKDTQGALFWTERALALDPENGRSRHLKGRILLDNKEPVLALAELVHATELLPNGYLPWLDLGRCYTELGKYDEAREALGRSRDIILSDPGPTGEDATPEALEGFRIYRQQLLDQVDGQLSRLP